jgi:hypothetical protein
MLLRGIVATLRVPWLRRRIATWEDRICLRLGKVVCVVDRSERRRLERSRYLLWRRRKS